MQFTKEELLLVFVTLTETVKRETDYDRKPSALMVDLMNKISDELTK